MNPCAVINSSPSLAFLIHISHSCFLLTAAPVFLFILLVVSALVLQSHPSSTLTCAEYSLWVERCVTCFVYVISLIPC